MFPGLGLRLQEAGRYEPVADRRPDKRGMPSMSTATNPIFIDHDGNGAFDPPGGKTCAYDMVAP